MPRVLNEDYSDLVFEIELPTVEDLSAEELQSPGKGSIVTGPLYSFLSHEMADENLCFEDRNYALADMFFVLAERISEAKAIAEGKEVQEVESNVEDSDGEGLRLVDSWSEDEAAPEERLSAKHMERRKYLLSM